MNAELMNGIAIVAGTLGLWIVLVSIVGQMDFIYDRFKKVSKLQTARMITSVQEKAKNAEDNWPLPARLMKSFSSIGKVKTENNRDLMIRLIQAGLPYYSAEHYYSRMVANTILFAGAVLLNLIIISLFVKISPFIILGVAFIAGVWGAMQPASEVASKTNKRRSELILDMTYQLPRLIIMVEAKGNLTAAITTLTAESKQTTIDAKKKAEIEKVLKNKIVEFEFDLMGSLVGFGGNVFAELLNRFAMERNQNIPAEEIAERMKLYFPNSIELENFLEILVAGSAGMPMKDRLMEMSSQMRDDLRARAREAGAKAKTYVIMASALELLPLFAIVGAPVLFMASQMLN